MLSSYSSKKKIPYGTIKYAKYVFLNFYICFSANTHRMPPKFAPKKASVGGGQALSLLSLSWFALILWLVFIVYLFCTDKLSLGGVGTTDTASSLHTIDSLLKDIETKIQQQNPSPLKEAKAVQEDMKKERAIKQEGPSYYLPKILYIILCYITLHIKLYIIFYIKLCIIYYIILYYYILYNVLHYYILFNILFYI